ncbi:MAG: PLDc N-terminal domain-containing protein [Bacteroidaceae bacterium]|jgi:hypothetical protein|nr:PLDc N-terminal domain-containing protein [Bacteroidaceae bacterium]MBQ4038312.1 PLDc N-terminal domain-containing protein [Bacteroidaceae bacterium]MBR6805635.1 PLDc N-terminal domain-containing protein [Bacteroidaceae bacterium]
MGTIIWLAGIVCAIWCVLDIFKKPISIVGKLIMTVIVLATSWLGLILYYFWARHQMTSWFK